VNTLAVAPAELDRTGGEPTLDDLIVSAWEGLTAHRVVECPACRGEMDPAYAAHARPIGGRCTACGATLG
jgi:hypothetical protein